MGCQLAFHDRSRKVAGSFLKLLEGLNIDFTLLGKEETCCGDLARRLGNEYLSRKSVSKNIETFRKYGIQKIVTLCPHCFHAFKDEYPPWGGEVLHYTQFLAKLMEGGALSVPSLLDQKVAYHDSCYLGRYHQIYEEPRSILKRIVKGEAIEMVRNRAASLCCGGGGGGFWMRGNWGERINRNRIKEARDRGAQILSTSCPYCLVMLEEAIRSQEIKGLEVMDLIEVIDRLRS
jgi:Fe-S oxidoreductase